MQSLGTYGETQKHALLKPTLTAVPSLPYPQTVLLHLQGLRGGEWLLALARHSQHLRSPPRPRARIRANGVMDCQSTGLLRLLAEGDFLILI